MRNPQLSLTGLLMATGFLFSITLHAQQNSPLFPPKDVTPEMDRDQMMLQLGIKFPTLLSKTEDKNAPAHTWPADSTNPGGNWTDRSGHIITRSGFGLWNNYNEELAGHYTPIDLLKMKNGTRITNSKEWWLRRRPEVVRDVENEVWGKIPHDSILPAVSFSVVTTTGGRGNTAYLQKDIRGRIDISRYPQVRDTPVINAILRIPATATTAVPVMIVYGNPLNVLDIYWERCIQHGWGVCIFNPTALQPDNGRSLTSYLIGLVNKGNWRKPTDWGSLGAWSWGISRLIDYFETDKLVDAKKIGLAGHSRYGKATLLAMAYEPRIAISFPSCGGALGPAMVRRHWGQDLENIGWEREYHWVAGNFFKYMGPLKEGEYLPRKVELLPVDAHSLVALCAPRPIFLNGGTEDSWSDPYGTYLTAKGASPVYELLGKKGVVMNDDLPKVDVGYLSGSIGYRLHKGGHTDAPDWTAFFDFAARHIHAAVIKTPSDYITMEAGENSSALLKIASNEHWKVANMHKWLTLSKTSSSGTDSIILSATPNTGASARTATLVITSDGKRQVVTVNQAAANPTLNISRDELTIGDAANSTTALGITSNTAWTLTVDAPWLKADDAGVNNKTIILTADANRSVEKRTARVTIIAEGVESHIVTVTQRGRTPAKK